MEDLLLKYEDAKKLVFKHIKPLEKEICFLEKSQWRTLSKNILAPYGMPLFDNSAVDGYAVKAVDLKNVSQEKPVSLKNLGYISAGDALIGNMNHGECIQIATGAPIPPEADSIVRKEDVILNDPYVRFLKSISKEENVRFQGEDIKKGQIVISGGSLIGPAQIAVLATFGFAKVPVRKIPKVSIISTGSELIGVKDVPKFGQIRESNRYMLAGMVKQEYCKLEKISLVPDIPKILKKEFKEALNADIVLISGGMSVGDKDFAKPILKELGVEEIFWKIKFKPGKPLFFGRRDKTFVFGIPGNPASSYVIFEEFIRPALRKLMGRRKIENDMVFAKLDETISKSYKRLHFMRGILGEKNGEYHVRPLSFQGSHSIGSLIESNALIRVEANSPVLSRGIKVAVRPLINEIE